MENTTKRNQTLPKYFNTIKEKTKIALKENKEYKLNLWSVIAFDISTTITMLIFLTVYISTLSGILEWDFTDMLLFNTLAFISGKINYSFSIRYFSQTLLSGTLNIYLTKPLHSYFLSSIEYIRGATIPTFIGFTTLAIIILFNKSYSNILLAILLFIFGSIYYIAYANFFSSLSFFMKKSNSIHETFSKFNFFNEEYTPVTFKDSSLKWLFFLLPSSTYGFFTIELLNNRYELLTLFLPYILISFIILTIGIIITWHYGLKNYEAFG